MGLKCVKIPQLSCSRATLSGSSMHAPPRSMECEAQNLDQTARNKRVTKYATMASVFALGVVLGMICLSAIEGPQQGAVLCWLLRRQLPLCGFAHSSQWEGVPATSQFDEHAFQAPALRDRLGSTKGCCTPTSREVSSRARFTQC